MNNTNIFVIVPSYNEASVIRENLLALLKKGYTVVLVDDGSTDNTASIINDLPINYLRHPLNLGQGAALQTGMSFALRNRSMEYVVHFDADGQHDISDIKSMLSICVENRADIVLGSRFLRKSDSLQVPFLRRFVLKIGRIINFAFYGVYLSDTHNGFRLLTRNSVELIEIEENGSAHASEIIELIKKSKLKFVEAPVTVKYTDYSKSKGQSFSAGFGILIDMILRKII